MSLLKQYLSMEDNAPVPTDADDVAIEVPEVEPVTEEEEYEAEEALDEAESDRAAEVSDIANHDNFVDEAEELSESLEAFQEILEHGLESGQFSPQFAAIMDTTLNSYKEVLGLEHYTLGLENYNSNDLEEFYKVALEATSEGIYKIGHAPENALGKLYDKIAGSVAAGKRAATAKAITKKADAALDALSGMNAADKVTISLKGMSKKLTQNGSFPTNLVEAVKKDQKATDYLLNKYAPEAIARQQDMVKASMDAVKDARANKGDSASAKADKFATGATPESKIPSNIKDGSTLLGSIQVKVPEVEKGENTAATLKAMAKAGKLKFKADKIGDVPSEVELKVSEVRSLLNGAKAYAVMIEKSGKDLGEKIKAGVKFTQMQQQYIANEGDMLIKIFKKNPEIQALRKLGTSYGSVGISAAADGFSHAKTVAKSLISIGERAKKKTGKKEEKKED